MKFFCNVPSNILCVVVHTQYAPQYQYRFAYMSSNYSRVRGQDIYPVALVDIPENRSYNEIKPVQLVRLKCECPFASVLFRSVCVIKQWRREGVCRPGAGANVFVAALTPAIRSPIVILMVTTMALVWTVNCTLSWGSKFQNSIFLPLQMPPLHSAARGRGGKRGKAEMGKGGFCTFNLTTLLMGNNINN